MKNRIIKSYYFKLKLDSYITKQDERKVLVTDIDNQEKGNYN